MTRAKDAHCHFDGREKSSQIPRIPRECLGGLRFDGALCGHFAFINYPAL